MRRLLAPLVVLIVLAAFPVGASASVTQYASGSCTFHWHAHGDTVPFLCLTESSALSGDKLILTGSSDLKDLGIVDHAPTGFCSPRVAGDDDWNDCVSGVWAKLGTSDSFCVYHNGDYHQIAISAAAPLGPPGSVWTYSYNLADYGENDHPSSVMLQQSGTPCGEGGV